MVNRNKYFPTKRASFQFFNSWSFRKFVLRLNPFLCKWRKFMGKSKRSLDKASNKHFRIRQ